MSAPVEGVVVTADDSPLEPVGVPECTPCQAWSAVRTVNRLRSPSRVALANGMIREHPAHTAMPREIPGGTK